MQKKTNPIFECPKIADFAPFQDKNNVWISRHIHPQLQKITSNRISISYIELSSLKN